MTYIPSVEDKIRFEQAKQMRHLLEFGCEHYVVVQLLRFYLGGILSTVSELSGISEYKTRQILKELSVAKIIISQKKPLENDSRKFSDYFFVNENIDEWKTKEYINPN